MLTLCIGSFDAGKFCSGSDFKEGLRFCHLSHELIKLAICEDIPGQKYSFLAKLPVRVIPECDICNWSKIDLRNDSRITKRVDEKTTIVSFRTESSSQTPLQSFPGCPIINFEHNLRG
jgi:hypothetical protein